MKDEKETREKLLASARQEFLEKGYTQASLRSICKNAGVTTGALYFFFQDKEDLFTQLVEPTLQKLREYIRQHFQAEQEMIISGVQNETEDADDIRMTRQILHAMYQNYDILLLAITKSQGSKYEYCVDEFVAIAEQHYRFLADGMAARAGIDRIDDYTIHWIAHMQIDVFVHMLQHEPSEEKAQQYIGKIVDDLVAGWMSIFVACDQEGPTKWEDALSLSNEQGSLQKVSSERSMSCIKDA